MCQVKDKKESSENKDAAATPSPASRHKSAPGRSPLSDSFDFVLGIKVPVTSLCPCSRELSSYGAHNQRSIMTVQVRYNEFIWIEDLIEIIEECGSSPVYSLLKREDEKYVTERAYENPRFVEDMVREATVRLLALDNITWFSVEAENFESIHKHSAYAAIERSKS